MWGGGCRGVEVGSGMVRVGLLSSGEVCLFCLFVVVLRPSNI